MRGTSVLVLTLVALFAPALPSALAQEPEPLCVLDEDAEEADDATETPETDDEPTLDGRLGGTRESFEDRFGEPSDDGLFITYSDLEGCGEVLISYHEDILTTVNIFSPGFSDDEAEWTIEEAERIAARLLPSDVEYEESVRNVSFVEHRIGTSETLAGQVPDSAYAYVDNNPTPGQFSVAYQLDDNDEVLSFTVQLQVEDPN